MEKKYITWEMIRDRMQIFVLSKYKRTVKAYGVPRGGVALASMLYPVDTPEEAEIIIDDLIDSGATRDAWQKRFPDKEFIALCDKQTEPALAGKWLVFPWEENEHENEPAQLSALIDIARNYERLAIGGVARMGNKKSLLRPFLRKCFATLLDNGPAGFEALHHRVHGFGCTFDWAMREFPFYSVDSTYWRHGSISFRMLKTKGVFYKGYDLRRKKGVNRHTVRGADTREGLNYNHRNLNNILNLLELNKNITALWQSRGITWKN